MALEPHIIHIVGHTEAHHAATASDVIEASMIARRAIQNALSGAPDMTADPAIQQQVEHLVSEANLTLQAIQNLGGQKSADPWADPVILARAVSEGILDAPQLLNNPFAKGKIKVRMVKGSCVAVDPDGSPIPEAQRLRAYLD
jgi:hypothetical protein